MVKYLAGDKWSAVIAPEQRERSDPGSLIFMPPENIDIYLKGVMNIDQLHSDDELLDFLETIMARMRGKLSYTSQLERIDEQQQLKGSQLFQTLDDEKSDKIMERLKGFWA